MLLKERLIVEASIKTAEKLERKRSCFAFSNWHEALLPKLWRKRSPQGTGSPPKKHLQAKEDIQTLMRKYRPIVSPCYLNFRNRLDIKEPKYISRAEFFERISIDPLSFGGNRSSYPTHIKPLQLLPILRREFIPKLEIKSIRKLHTTLTEIKIA